MATTTPVKPMDYGHIKNLPINFTSVVDDFEVNYVVNYHTFHLKAAL